MGVGKVVRIRKVRSTALIYCEGAHDLAFIRYLIGLYSRERTIKTKFRTRQGKGGSPDTLVVEAVNIPGSFDRRLVKADYDRAAEELQKAETLAGQHKIVIIWSQPCIESMLLTILDGKDYSRMKSKECKALFEAAHIPASKRTDMRSYEKMFALDVLETARKKIEELDKLIKFIVA